MDQEALRVVVAVLVAVLVSVPVPVLPGVPVQLGVPDLEPVCVCVIVWERVFGGVPVRLTVWGGVGSCDGV